MKTTLATCLLALAGSAALGYEAVLTDDTFMPVPAKSAALAGSYPSLTVSSNRIAIFKFDLTSYRNGGVAPSNILSATFKVFVNKVVVSGPINVAAMEGEWSETSPPSVVFTGGIAFNNQVPVIGARRYASFDVTDQVRQPGTDPGDTAREKAQTQLVADAARILNGPLVELLDTIRREKDQTINHQELDQVLRAEWDKDAKTNAETLARDFSAWLAAHKDQLAALTIYFDQPFRRREVTFAMLEQVMARLRSDAPRFAPLRVWQAYRHLENYQGKQPVNELTALVALIRRACGIDPHLTAFDDTVRKNFQDWIMARHAGAGTKFTEPQMAWLQNRWGQVTFSSITEVG